MNSVERFWAKVDKSRGPEACWIWTASTSGGYGRLGSSKFETVLAHRRSWELERGPIPEDMCVLHNCPDGDNPLCVNPKHLWLGTRDDNNADRDKKGRNGGWKIRGNANGTRKHPEAVVRGDRHPSRTQPERLARGDANGSRTHPERLRRGEAVTHAKLNDNAVREIRDSSESVIALAALYDVSRTLIRSVRARKIWKHVL